MTTKTLHKKTMDLIENYQHFGGENSTPVPYFNNRRNSIRAGLRAQIGKGTINDITEEADVIAMREKIDLKKVSSSELKQFLVKHNLGIDCSGFAYHVLDTESESRGKGTLKKSMWYPYARNVFRKLLSKLRSVESTGVTTFAHEKNSCSIPLSQVEPGDFITMLYSSKESGDRNHIVLIDKVDYDNNTPTVLYYTHSMAWPSDGEYGHGVRVGKIEITDFSKPVQDQLWIENEKTGEENYTHQRALKATSTEIRRLNWF